jgi:peptidoglycan/LPS O-acetylase OafA/YrhL
LLFWFTPGAPSSPLDLLWTSHYLVLFAAGAALASNRAAFKAAFTRSGSRAGLLVLAIALVILASDAGMALSPGLRVCVGAILLVSTCAFNEPVAKVLQAPSLVWLGSVSFSVYLVHLPILLTLIHLLHGQVPVLILAAMALPITIGIAALVERWVERPAQSLARRVFFPASRQEGTQKTEKRFDEGEAPQPIAEPL